MKAVDYIPRIRTCAHCKQQFEKTVRFDKNGRNRGVMQMTQFCSASCRNHARCPQPKGYMDKHGYRVFLVDGKHRPEHRIVMEKMIGRKLLPQETVHHKNGKRADNRPENLELWSSRHGRGQRVSDRIQDCVEFLREYAPEYLKHDGKGCEIVSLSDALNGIMCNAS